MANAHLIAGDAGCILVDAGMPGSERKIAKVLTRHGLSMKDIKLIVVTHAHVDHAGSAASLRKLSGAPILAHRDDADFYSRRVPMTFCPTGRVGRLFLKTPLPHEPYEGFEPDILLRDSDTVNLADFGVDGIVRHTAGHTPGSIAVELSSQDALVGDLIASGILLGGIAFTGIRFATKRSRSGCTVRSLVATMYQLGFVFHAVPSTFWVNKSAAGAK